MQGWGNLVFLKEPWISLGEGSVATCLETPGLLDGLVCKHSGLFLTCSPGEVHLEMSLIPWKSALFQTGDHIRSGILTPCSGKVRVLGVGAGGMCEPRALPPFCSLWVLYNWMKGDMSQGAEDSDLWTSKYGTMSQRPQGFSIQILDREHKVNSSFV